MDTREVMRQTISNMNLIYKDVNRICQLVEEKMKSNGFKAMGNAAVTWDVSQLLGNPESWLNRWYARVYLHEKFQKKAVGFCIHLCEEGFYQDQLDLLASMNITLPVMSISLLDLKQKVNEFNRYDLYNMLWYAGWLEMEQKTIGDFIVQGDLTVGTATGRSTTYFVDLLSLTTEKDIEQLVAEPMKEMLMGKPEWVVQNNLPVIKLSEIQS